MTNKQNSLTDNEYAVLNVLDTASSAVSQREIARSTGYSLGLINAVLKKLIQTGYIKTLQLNQRSIDYILTPRGFREKCQKTYQYVLRTVQNYQAMNQHLVQVLSELQQEGITDIYINGDGDLTDFIVRTCTNTNVGVRKGLPKNIRRQKKSIILNPSVQTIKNSDFRVIELAHEFTRIHG